MRHCDPGNFFRTAFFFIALCFFSCGLFAQTDSRRPRAGRDALPKIQDTPAAETEGTAPPIVDSGFNVVTENNSQAGPSARVPEGSLAAQTAVKGETITWRAKWVFKGRGGPRIPCAALSPDKTVAVIAETTGAEDGPFGTRLVLINTLDLNVCKIITVDRKIGAMEFIPGPQTLICAAERQLPLKQPLSLFALDCRSGKIVSEADFKRSVSSMTASSGGKLFVKAADSPEIFVFKGSDLTAKPEIITTQIPEDGALALSPDGKTLVCSAGGGKAVFFNAATGKQSAEKKIPDSVTPARIEFLGNPEWIVFFTPDGDSAFLKGGNAKVFMRASGAAMTFDSKDSTLFAEAQKNSEIALFSVPAMEPAGSISPLRILPKTGAAAQWLAVLEKGSLLELDKNGSVIVFDKPSGKGKFWKKTLVCASERMDN
jgi:hypothetical protein